MIYALCLDESIVLSMKNQALIIQLLFREHISGN